MQKFDIAALKFVFDITQTLVMVGISIYVWIVTNNKVTNTSIRELETKHSQEIDDLKVRLASIDTKMSLMPDKRSMHNLHQRMNTQSETLYKIQGELKGIADNNAIILEKLLKQN